MMEIDFVSLFHVEFSSCAITIHLDSFQKRPGVMVLVSCPENYTHSVENFFTGQTNGQIQWTNFGKVPKKFHDFLFD